MLAALTVRDIVLIETAALEFAPGLNVLTGETGAGKSILLDALGPGGRRTRRRPRHVRAGAAQGSATAVFEPAPDHPACAPCWREQAIDGGGRDRACAARLPPTASTRAFINDEPVGVALLQGSGRRCCWKCMARPTIAACSMPPPIARCWTPSAAMKTLRRRRGALCRIRSRRARRWTNCKALAAAAACRCRLSCAHAVDELSDFAPRRAKKPRSPAERALLMNAARIAEDVSAAIEAAVGRARRGSVAGGGAEETVAHERRGAQGGRCRRSRAGTGLALAEEARRELDALLSRLDTDTGELERKEERLFALARPGAQIWRDAGRACRACCAEFRAKHEALDSAAARSRRPKPRSRRRARPISTAARKLSKARAGAAREAGNGGGGGTGAAETRPCQISRCAGAAATRTGAATGWNASPLKSPRWKARRSARWRKSPRAASWRASRWR